MRIELCAQRAAEKPDRFHQSFGAKCGSGDQIRMAAHIFGQRVDRNVRAALERMLINGSKQSIVADDGRPMLFSENLAYADPRVYASTACSTERRSACETSRNGAVGFGTENS